ncbi:hypothetical protein ASE26_23735 [Duganella sp. Root198D2]|nr:hypothetical protein ASE26_23735 [Duganella sp. Root198D2]
MQRGFTFDEHDVALLLRDGIVPHAFGDDKRFAFMQDDRPVFHFDCQRAFEDVKKFVLIFVAVPGERAKDLGNLDEGVVKLSHYAR